MKVWLIKAAILAAIAILTVAGRPHVCGPENRAEFKYDAKEWNQTGKVADLLSGKSVQYAFDRN